MSWGGIFVV